MSLASPLIQQARLAVERVAAPPHGVTAEPIGRGGDHGDPSSWLAPPPVRLSDGTHVQLYKDGMAWQAAFDAIAAARQRICLEVYIFASDTVGQAIADLFCTKARQGVRVYVIYDAFGSMRSDPAMFRRMRRAGVSLQVYHPLRPWECRFGWRPLNRDHRKLLLIDDDTAGMGGLNLATEYAGSWTGSGGAGKAGKTELWRDNAIGVRGPSARLFHQAFARSWNYTLRGGRIRRAELIHNIDGHAPGAYASELGLLASVPTLSSPLQPFLCRLLRQARQSILLTMAYFAPDDTLIGELCRAADRGVRVRLMLPGNCDVGLLLTAARSFYETLMSHGIEIYERQGVVLHAKTMVIDAHTTIIGSTNLDYRSIEYNSELSAILRCPDFARQMGALFDDDVRFAQRISLLQWRRRPLWDRVVQWSVSRARYWL